MIRLLFPIFLMASFSASASVNVDLREVKDIHCSELMNLNEVFTIYGITSAYPRMYRSNINAIDVKSVTKNSLKFGQYGESLIYTITLKSVVSTYKGRKILAEYSYHKGNPTTLACDVTYYDQSL